MSSPKSRNRGSNCPPPHHLARAPHKATAAPNDGYWVWGHHAVRALLSSSPLPPRTLIDLVVSDPSHLHALTKDVTLAPTIPHRVIPPSQFRDLLGADAVHQGIAAKIKPRGGLEWRDFIQSPPITPENPQGRQCWVMLDQVTDPHNVGAIVRSCAAFGIRGVILPKNNAPQESGTMAKAASGALEIVPLCYVTNLRQTLEAFKEEGFWIAGLAEGAEVTLDGFDWPEKTVLVMGSEQKGLRPLVAETCDYTLTIPSVGYFSTLNVSVATAVCCYAWHANLLPHPSRPASRPPSSGPCRE